MSNAEVIALCIGLGLACVLVGWSLRDGAAGSRGAGSRDLYLPLIYQALAVTMLFVPLAIWAIWRVLTLDTPPFGLVPGVIGGATVALGWLVASLLRQFESLASLSREREMVMRALREEIFLVFEIFDAVDQEAAGKGTRKQIMDSSDSDKYMPYPTSISPPVIFNAIGSRVHLIEGGPIEKVTRFYAAYSELASYTEDFRSETIRNLENTRRATAYDILESRRGATLLTAYEAVRALDDALRSTERWAPSGKNQKMIEGRKDTQPDDTGGAA